MGRRHLRLRSGVARVFRQAVREPVDDAGSGAAGRRDHQSARAQPGETDQALLRRQQIIVRRMGIKETPPPPVPVPANSGAAERHTGEGPADQRRSRIHRAGAAAISNPAS